MGAIENCIAFDVTAATQYFTIITTDAIPPNISVERAQGTFLVGRLGVMVDDVTKTTEDLFLPWGHHDGFENNKILD